MFVRPDLFLDAIAILIHDNGARNQSTVNELISLYEEDKKGASSAATIDADLINAYIYTCRQMIQENLCHEDKSSLKVLLTRLKSDKAFEKRRDIFDLLSDILLSTSTMTATQLQGHRDRVINAIMSQRAMKHAKQVFSKLNKLVDVEDPEEQRRVLTGALRHGEDLTKLFTEATTLAAENNVQTVNLRNLESVRQSVTRYVDRSVRGVIKTGLQGLNRALGQPGGIALGRSFVFNALPHNYKSGILMSCAIWTLLYNEPPASVNGKPVVLFITLENEVDENIAWIFRKAYHAETGASPDLLSDEEVIHWITDFFSRKGYELMIERYLPEKFGYPEYCARIKYLKESGYDVILTIIDYLRLARKGGSEKATNAARDLMVGELFSNFCNFNKHNGITFGTAHPLNRPAKMLAGSGTTNVVQKFGAEYLADSLDVEREVDISIYCHIEKNHAGESFLTFFLTKHRYVDGTPNAHKSFAYKFDPVFGIIDDINGAPKYVKDIYAVNFDDGNEDEASGVAAVF